MGAHPVSPARSGSPTAVGRDRPLAPGRSNASPLWRRPDFARFWAAQTVSELGSQVTLLAFPLIAALTLGATPFQLGLLAAAGTAPFLAVGLVAGAWVDRLRRRPVLVAADLGRAALLAAIPTAGLLGALRMELLYAVALLVGVLTVFFDVAYLAYLPTLVGREELVEGNGKLEASAATAQVVGPGLAGALVRLGGGPFAVLVDALSFLASALLLARIRTPEPAPPPAERPRVWREIGEGLRAVGSQPILRALAAASATATLGGFTFLAVYVLYLTRELGLGPEAVGAVFATGGAGALAGSALAGPARRRFGLGPTLVGAQLLFGLTGLLVPLAVLVPAGALPLMVAAECLQWLTLVVYTVNAVSLRQALTPDHLQGRVNATMRVVAWGMRPVGALLGGVLGGVIGLPLTLVVGEVAALVAVVWLLASPLPRLREPPA